jgi:hypothetical protein
MFIRRRNRRPTYWGRQYHYQACESYRENGRVRQRVICTLEPEPLSRQLRRAKDWAEHYREVAAKLQLVFDAIGEWEPPEE